MIDLLWWATVALLLTHELDAMKQHEWRVLPLTRSLPEHTGEQVFIWLHVPVFLVVLALAESEAFRVGFCVFAIVHVGLHWLFRNHPKYEFADFGSRALIVLPGVAGAAYLSGAAVAG
ncbi:MAG: DUF6713 family protein [Salinarimonas sp.]